MTNVVSQAWMDKRNAAVNKSKVGTVMSEFKQGSLKSGNDGKVTNRKQAIAIALSEARKKGSK